MVDVRVVGFGKPKHSMGWYHSKQLVDSRVNGAVLTAIVSPSGLAAGSELQTWAKSRPEIADGRCKLYAKVADMVKERPATPTSVVVIACRTVDMPQRLRDVIDHGFKFVYLEKPGAPSLGELEELAQYAEKHSVKVFMGYNKNVAHFVQEARSAQAASVGSNVLFEHNNTYKPEELGSCFESNSEGMLKNMVIHELMLAITFFGVTVSTLKHAEVDKNFSRCETRGAFTDFSRVQFTMTTCDGKSVTVRADRCGGSTSKAIVSNAGKDIFTSVMPNAELERRVAEMDAAEPGVTPYLHVQDEQYLSFKQKLCDHVKGGPAPEGMPTIQQGVEVLRLAEHLTPLFMSQLQVTRRCGIALIGAGRMGQLRATHIFGNPVAELVCVVDPFIDGARKLAQQYHCGSYKSLQAALDADTENRITAIWISTPTFTHEECIRVAAKAGKAIFTEKPVAETPGDISTMFSVCKDAGVPLCCGFQRRFDTSYVAMKDAVARGDVGKIIFINVMFGDHPVPPIEFLSKGGCPFMDLVPHDADFIRWLLDGEEPEEVYATGSSSTEALKAANVCDNALMVAKYSSGVTATICLSRGACYGYDNRIEVFGSRGRLVVETPAETTLIKQDLAGTHTARLQHSFPQRFSQAFSAEVDVFARVSLREDGARWPVGEEECIAAQQVAMTAQLAKTSGCAQKCSSSGCSDGADKRRQQQGY